MNSKLLVAPVLVFTLFAIACSSTGGAGGVADEKRARARYEELVKQQDEINAEYSDGTSRQPRNLAVVSPRLSRDPYYSKSLSHKNMAANALSRRDWPAAYDQASKGLVELNKFRANRLIAQADELSRLIRRRGLDKSNPDVFARGVNLTGKARSRFNSADYVGSRVDAESAVTELRKVYGNMILVNDYTVVLGDCLWRISLKPEIYNDAYRWPKIYMANRRKFHQQDNPDLIYPGQVFSIPR
ncbi:MAG: LysM peptidoglycan-binding domain-containing protein [Spirochaetia bacterium]